MKKLVPTMVALLALPSFAIAQDSAVKNVQISGWGFVRHESKKDADYNNEAKDKTEFTSTRLNVNLKSDLADNYGYVIFQPQFSKISGQNEFVPSGTAANTSTATSGGTSDSRLDVHEAYFAIKPTQDENLYVFVGRQELAYGDHLIMGSIPWQRVGRSFDGAKVRYKLSDTFSIDAFGAKLQENTPTSTSANTVGQDTNLTGAYASGSFGESVKAADFYFLNRDNKTGTSPFRDTTAFGVRFKSPIANTAIDYRFEGTLEHVRLAGNTGSENGEYQIDAEVGYTLPFLTSRFSFEYFDSTKHFDQLFPTAHKFLGYADQFARRNIKGYVAHFSIKPYDKVSFLADYHIFQRHSKNDGAYDFAGNSMGSAGNSTDIGNELDLTVAYDFTQTLQVSAGYAIVNPGDYLEDQNASQKDPTNWAYLQLLARF
jgi:hypothetical protein